jgi:glycine cleavage system H protein
MTGGVLAWRLCDRGLDCASCPLDHAIRNTKVPAPRAEPEPKAAEFAIPERLFVHPGHLWVRLRPGGEMEVGVDALAGRLLGRVRDIRLPLEGDELSGGLPAVSFALPSVAVDLPAPFDGVVVRSNGALSDRPTLIGESPYEDGWLFRGVAPDPMAALAGLLRGEEASAWLECEGARARDLVEIAALALDADEGGSIEDRFSSLPSRVAGHVLSRLLQCSVRSIR